MMCFKQNGFVAKMEVIVFVLSHETAIQLVFCLRERAYSDGAFALIDDPFKRVSLPRNYFCSFSMAQLMSFAKKYCLPLPIHVFDFDRSRRQSSKMIRMHCMANTVPRRSFLGLETGVYVCAPELCLAQVAFEYSRMQMIRLVSDFCSDYLLPKGGNEIVSCERAMQLGRAEAYFRTLKGTHGAARALDAVRFAVEGSASPKETELALRLSLPYRLGGYALPKPRMNATVELDEMGFRLTGKRSVRCDLLWPEAKVGVEYDSDVYHTGPERIAADSARRDALLRVGITVVTVTREQLNSVRGMDSVADLIAKKTGKRIRCSLNDYELRKHALVKELRTRPPWG